MFNVAHIHWCLRAAEFWPPLTWPSSLWGGHLERGLRILMELTQKLFILIWPRDQKGWCQVGYKIWDPCRRLQFHSQPVEPIFCLLAPGLTRSQAHDRGLSFLLHQKTPECFDEQKLVRSVKDKFRSVGRTDGGLQWAVWSQVVTCSGNVFFLSHITLSHGLKEGWGPNYSVITPHISF